MQELLANEIMRNIKPQQYMNVGDMDVSEVMRLHELVYGNGNIPRPISYDEIRDVRHSSINAFLWGNGLYTFPTIELIDWLREQIDDDPDYVPDAIEICAGTGWIGRSLDIPATDAKSQERTEIRKLYEASGQPTIIYPNDIIKLDAHKAVKEYKPEYIIGSYVTGKYGLSGKQYGSIYGVDNAWIANHCHKYFMIGNLTVHGRDSVMRRNHEELSFPWLVTRNDSTLARIFVFENKQWR